MSRHDERRGARSPGRRRARTWREILADGARAAATPPCCDYTERFDQAELGPGAAAGGRRRARRRGRRARRRTCSDGLRTAIANVEAVARRSCASRWRSSLPEGQRVEIAEVPVRRAGDLRARRAGALPVDRRDGRRDGAGGRRGRDRRCAPRPGPGGRAAPRDPRRLRALRGRRGLPDGRRPGDRRAGLRHRVGRGGRRDRRARQRRTCRRPSARWSAASASTASPARASSS